VRCFVSRPARNYCGDVKAAFGIMARRGVLGGGGFAYLPKMRHLPALNNRNSISAIPSFS